MASTVRVPHGTMARFKKGCPCAKCHAASLPQAEVRKRSFHTEMLPIDTGLVRSMIVATDQPMATLGRKLYGRGAEDYLPTALKRGRMEVYRLDKLAVALGTHMASLVPDFAQVSERWAREGAAA